MRIRHALVALRQAPPCHASCGCLVKAGTCVRSVCSVLSRVHQQYQVVKEAAERGEVKLEMVEQEMQQERESSERYKVRRACFRFWDTLRACVRVWVGSVVWGVGGVRL